MQNLVEKSRIALEYDRVLEMLAQECSCEEGSEKALGLTPYCSLEQVSHALLETEDACRLSLKFGDPSFSGLKNISSVLHRAKLGSTLLMSELLQVAGVLSSIRSLKRYRESAESESTCLDKLFDDLAPNKYLEDKIHAVILSDEEIADNASPELSDIRRHIKRNGQKVREQLDKMTRSPVYQKFLQEPIVTIRGGRFVVPVKSEYKSEIPGLVHDTSASGATLFVEPMSAVEANNELRILYSREEKEINRILTELSDETGAFSDAIEESRKIAVELDFIFAKAKLALKMKAVAPRLSEDGAVELLKARHPLIDAKKAVPIDIKLGGEFDTLVITGPNTGGKTVVLKTLGLLCLMTMSGLMIPAGDNCRMSLFDGVLADIGDEQSIEQSLSTFSAHMSQIIGILEACGPHSLILLDELGSGTDPVEGAALAVAILEYIRKTGAKVAATTHYAELKVYALQTAGVENASCEFDVSTLRPTYRLLIGVPGRSNAFAISERLGLLPDIINRAQNLVSSENFRFEEVVQGLENSRQQMEQERERAAELRIEADRAKREAEQIRKELDSQKGREMEQARVQARRLVEQSRAQAQALLDDLDELKKLRDTGEIAALRELAKSQINSKLKKMENAANPVFDKVNDNYRLPRELKTGDSVMIQDIQKRGTVLSPADSSGMIEVQAGIVKTRVPVTGLRLITEKPSESVRKQSVRTNIDKSTIAVKPEIDLRGLTAEEALLELDKFIDNAQLASLGQISIIHGKGTGVLRNAVQQYLKKHHAVKSYRLGHYGEGENGVTIAELK